MDHRLDWLIGQVSGEVFGCLDNIVADYYINYYYYYHSTDLVRILTLSSELVTGTSKRHERT
jgi:hypothetical protein